MVVLSRSGGRPPVGPLAEAWRDPSDGLWRVRLLPAGQQRVSETMEKYPNPIALLKSVWAGLYWAAVRSGVDDDELNAACAEGICEACWRWRPDAGGSWSTYLGWHVRGAVCRLLTVRVRQRGREVEMSHRWRRSASGIEMDPLSRESGRDPELDAADEAAAVRRRAARVLAKLDKRTAKVVLARAGGATYDAIGARLGISKERVRQIQLAGMRKLRAEATAGG